MKRNVLIGGIAVVVAIVLVWYFLLYKPLGDDLTSTQAQVSQEQSTTQDLEATLSRLQSQAKNSTEQQALLNKLDQAVPEEPDLAEFIIEINQIAAEAGIDLLTISPSPPAAGTGASVIGVTITIQGSFFQLQDFLRLLEQMDRLVIIDSFNVSAGGGSSSEGEVSSDGTQLSVTLTGRMFTRAAPATTADGSPAPTTGTSSTTAPAGTSESTSTTAPAASSTTGGT